RSLIYTVSFKSFIAKKSIILPLRFPWLPTKTTLDFNHVIGNSSHEASLSRSFIPNLESSHLCASIISLQITLFPSSGFSIGITSHHAVFDGKSLSMFVKAWAYLCKKTIEDGESPPLLPELEPLFNREIIKDTTENNSIEILSKMFPNEKPNQRSLKIFSFSTKTRRICSCDIQAHA
ncbi:hypothetical protein KIW84_036131, partial [Lathyrus oleraceus]